MSFANPWALALVGLGVPLVMAYLHRLHRLKRNVPSTILMRTIRDERPASARARARLRHRLSLLLVALALVAGLVALVGPRGGGQGGRTIVVLDRSASMATRDGGGERLARAVAAVVEIAERANGDDELALVTAGGDPAVAVPPTIEHGDVVAKVKQVTAGGNNRDDGLAFALADGLCRDPDHSRIVVVSDGAGLAVPPTKCPIQSVPIGGEADNVGITGLSVRALDGLGLYDVHVAIASTASAPKHVEVNLSADGEIVDVASFDIPARGDVERTARLTINSGKTLTASIAGGDANPLDDKAEVALSGLGPVSVFLITSKKHSLVGEALKLHPRVTLEVAASEPAARAYDLIVIEDDSWRAPLPASRHVVALGAAPADAPISLGGEATQRGVVRWDFDSPWFRYVDLRDVIFTTSHLVAGGKPVVDSASGPLVATAPWGDRELVVTGFALDETDLALRAAFPNLIANLVDWAAPQLAAGPARGVLDVAESHVTAKPLPGQAMATGARWKDASWLARLAVVLAILLLLVEQALYMRRTT